MDFKRKGVKHMALKEFKSITVAPGTEEDEIRLWQTFGWELVGAPQEVRTSDSQIKTGADENYDYYKTIAGVHYIKLSFERKPERQNYEKLKSLETQYYEIKDPWRPYPPPGFITLLWVILIGLGFVCAVIPGIILLILRIIIYIKKNKQYDEDYAKYQEKMKDVKAKREEILAEAESLV